MCRWSSIDWFVCRVQSMKSYLVEDGRLHRAGLHGGDRDVVAGELHPQPVGEGLERVLRGAVGRCTWDHHKP